MSWWRERPPWLLPAFLSISVAALAVATNLATDLKTSWIAWLVWGMLVIAVAAVTAIVEHGSALPDEEEVKRVVDEAAFAMTLREWHGNETRGRWVFQQLQEYLADPVVVPKRKARKALAEAEHALHAADRDVDFEVVRKLVEPVMDVLPSEEDYLRVIRRLPSDVRLEQIEQGYDAKTRSEDRWAWSYLLLLKDLREYDKLLEILSKRLHAMRYVRRTGVTDAKFAYNATKWLAREVLGPHSYLHWLQQEGLEDV
jgi:hypothetical protein